MQTPACRLVLAGRVVGFVVEAGEGTLVDDAALGNGLALCASVAGVLNLLGGHGVGS